MFNAQFAGVILAAGSLVLGLPSLGCGETDDGIDAPEKLRDDIPDPVAGGVQVVGPQFQVGPGEEVFVCYRIDHTVAEEWNVQDSAVYQMNNGHHTLLYYASAEDSAGVDPAPHDCDGLDMSNVRIVTTGAANGTGLAMPEGVALRVPAGSELWAQSHYINATDEERTVQDVINLELIAPEDVVEVASTFSHVDLTFAIPPGETVTRTMECEIPQTMTVPWLLPHMHEWGKEFSLELLRAGAEEPFWEWSDLWYTNLRNDFPIQELDDYITLEPGDRIRTSCTWTNTEATSLLFPKEMCVTFFPFFPGDGGLIACDETGRSFTP